MLHEGRTPISKPADRRVCLLSMMTRTELDRRREGTECTVAKILTEVSA